MKKITEEEKIKIEEENSSVLSFVINSDTRASDIQIEAIYNAGKNGIPVIYEDWDLDSIYLLETK